MERRTGGGTLLLCAREVGELLGIDEVTVHRWNAVGRIPAPVMQSRGCTRWSRPDLLAWIDWRCPERKAFDSLKRNRR